MQTPYSLPSGFFLISFLYPFSAQNTDAGFAIPEPGVVTNGDVGAGVDAPEVFDGWVHPERTGISARLRIRRTGMVFTCFPQGMYGCSPV
jgi:hypothetical protein